MTSIVSGELVLYVKVANGYITYNLDGGENAPENKEFYEAVLGLELADPTKEGFTFGGWYLDAELSVEFTGITAETTGNIELFAKWVANAPVLPEEGEGILNGANVTIGTDLTMNYHATVNPGDNVSMVITMNGKEVVISGETENGINYVFDYQNIAPHLMSSNISAQLVVNGKVSVEKTEYSVYENLVNTFNRATSVELKTLVADTLNYGAMAQAYKNHDVENLVNNNVDIMAYASNFETLTETDFTNVTENAVEGFKISGAGVYFDFVNNVYIKFKAGADFRVTISTDGKEEAPADEIKFDGTYYRAYSAGISALDFDKVYTFKLYSGATLVQTVNYSVKTFVYNKQNGGDATANLAKALYTYGSATVAYKASL
jgi:uncharacterized repeat protein (TIGR02543 family)